MQEPADGAGAQCRADGQLILPGNVSPDWLPVPEIGAAAPQTPTQVAPDAALAPAPDRVAVPLLGPADGDGAAPGAGDPATLLAAVEASTVLVLAEGPEGLPIGSGFVVAPGLIVTNRHVIEGAAADQINVTHARLCRAEPARLLKAEGPFDQSGRDFALWRLESAALPALVLAATAASQKLHHVAAAGFPGDGMATDAGFRQLVQGDAAAIPDLVVVDGTVNALQEMPHGAEVLVHSAPRSAGHSGGPLVECCARVLGVNTFVRQGPLRTLNFAVSTAPLARCLAGTPAEVAVQSADCAPALLPRPRAPLAAGDPKAPEVTP